MKCFSCSMWHMVLYSPFIHMIHSYFFVSILKHFNAFFYLITRFRLQSFSSIYSPQIFCCGYFVDFFVILVKSSEFTTTIYFSIVITYPWEHIHRRKNSFFPFTHHNIMYIFSGWSKMVKEHKINNKEKKKHCGYIAAYGVIVINRMVIEKCDALTRIWDVKFEICRTLLNKQICNIYGVIDKCTLAYTTTFTHRFTKGTKNIIFLFFSFAQIDDK